MNRPLTALLLAPCVFAACDKAPEPAVTAQAEPPVPAAIAEPENAVDTPEPDVASPVSKPPAPVAEPSAVKSRPDPGTPNLKCSTVADCARVEIYLAGDRQCCESCADDVANADWVEEFAAWCDARSSDDACRPVQCADMVPGVVACERGTCVLHR